MDAAGRRVRGAVMAKSDGVAFEQIKRSGLAPLRIRLSDRSGPLGDRAPSLTDREAAEFLASLSALLAAGADMRTALDILGDRGGRGPTRALARALLLRLGGGAGLEESFGSQLGRNGPFVAALISSGDLSGGLQRAAEVLQARIKLKDQLVSVISYPAFVAVSTLVALAVIVLFVAPALAPLVSETGGHTPATLGALLAVSDFVHVHWAGLVVGMVLALAGLVVLGRAGLLGRLWEAALLDGPVRRTAAGLVFGGFAVGLGNMLSGGASTSEALRLAIRSAPTRLARQRLDPVVQAVREGQPLSTALESVRAFPDAIIRLTAVGEASGALGTMLARAGRLEEETAIRRIEAMGRVLGPALIVGLGAIIGLMMGSLLTGLSQLGQAALQ